MSEAVVDDIVAVLPPLLQSLEALGFVARHLNPPDFDAVMEAAGTPDQALRAVRARLAGLAGAIRRYADLAASGERRGARGVRRVARGPARPWRPDGGVSRAALCPARAGSAVSAGRQISAGERVLPRSRAARRRRPAGAARGTGASKTPASSTTITSPAAAAASRSMCRNITRPTAPGRW